MSDEELKKVANEVRKGIVTGVHAAKSGHPGRFARRCRHHDLFVL